MMIDIRGLRNQSLYLNFEKYKKRVVFMNILPKIGDLLYAESGYLIVRHLEVIAIEKKENISESIVTVLGKYGRKYNAPLWMFSGVE